MPAQPNSVSSGWAAMARARLGSASSVRHWDVPGFFCKADLYLYSRIGALELAMGAEPGAMLPVGLDKQTTNGRFVHRTRVRCVLHSSRR